MAEMGREGVKLPSEVDSIPGKGTGCGCRRPQKFLGFSGSQPHSDRCWTATILSLLPFLWPVSQLRKRRCREFRERLWWGYRFWILLMSWLHVSYPIFCLLVWCLANCKAAKEEDGHLHPGQKQVRTYKHRDCTISPSPVSQLTGKQAGLTPHCSGQSESSLRASSGSGSWTFHLQLAFIAVSRTKCGWAWCY